MDYFALGKHTFAFSSSLFDVVSDVVNSLNFLGYYNNSMDSSNSTFAMIEPVNYTIPQNKTDVSNVTYRNVAEETSEAHKIWGIISMLLVFLPWVIGGSILLLTVSSKE